MKIEARELRVGNLLHIEDVDELIEVSVDGLSKAFNDSHHDIEVMFKDGMYTTAYIEECKPIPLTEEWLVKFGIDNEYDITIKAGKKSIKFQWGTRIVKTGYRSSWRCNKYKHIKSVHQLQNLYFALTGEELTLKNGL